MSSNIVMVLVAVGLAALSLNPKTLKSRQWRATVTPLASIIGSGFLVAGPILSHASGKLAWVAMSGLCGLAYLFGSAIRHNIKTVEPALEGSPPKALAGLEKASDLALAFAYFISVAYYLNLFAAFGLRGAGVIDETMTRFISTAVIALLAGIGFTRGLRWLEHVELIAVGAKLALIGGVIAALGWVSALAIKAGSFEIPTVEHNSGFHEIRILLGLVILVQGFETSRYLGRAYKPEMRVRTMRHAQWLATAIYIVFILMMTPYFRGDLPAQGGETAIIDMLRPIGTFVAPMIIIAALASQLSAAVADMNGAGGLLDTATPPRFTVKWGYFATGCVAVGVTWAANIFEIIAYASKAFVLYYGLQAVTAAYMAARADKPRWGLVALYGVAAVIAAGIVAFGLPAEGG